MKKFKYFTSISLLASSMLFACSDNQVNPIQRGGDEEEDDPIIIAPPAPTNNTTYPLDTIN